MDPWQILGVNPGDSDKDLRKAVRRLAKQYHPDCEQGSEEKIKKINLAYHWMVNHLINNKVPPKSIIQPIAFNPPPQRQVRVIQFHSPYSCTTSTTSTSTFFGGVTIIFGR